MSKFRKLSRDSFAVHIAGRLRTFIFLGIGMLCIMGTAAVVVFFIALRGAEETMVPNVQNKELTAALLELQVKELYPRIQLRYSQSNMEKGLILEQDPQPGTIVKAGRRIRLVVSQGAVINTIENYRGRNLDEVKLDLRTLFALAASAAGEDQPLLSLKEPPMYEYSSEPAGTILQQRPAPGTAVSGPTTLEFVVSRGPEQLTITVPDFTGLTVSRVLEQIQQRGINFLFELRPVRGNEPAGIAVYQDPPAQTVIDKKRPVSILITAPQDGSLNGDVFALFSHTLPENPYPLPVRLEALLPSGERRLLVEVEFPGGDFTLPYQLPPESTLILSTLNRELYRKNVEPSLDNSLLPPGF
ncbi:MAG: PASTA domain-containing protein [Spirochaetaceae bacterium]|jgi:beta-lactam-binding protein with PASTA domain|nr:PASTA domain-containing protein [Spirochaetaceae bacterium]